MVTTHNVAQNSDEWYEARVGKFTASNAIKLLKHGRSQKARVSEERTFTNKYMQRGHDLEPQAIELYEEARQVKVERPGFLTNDKYPDCLFSPDGITDNRVIEVKCFKEERHHAVKKNIPAEILAQIHFGMIIAELDKAHLVMYNPDIENLRRVLYIIPIRKDKRLERRLKKLMKGVDDGKIN